MAAIPPSAPRRRLSRAPVFSLLACLFVATAFAHVNIIGRYDHYRFCGYIYRPYKYIPPIPDDDDDSWLAGPREQPDDYSYHYYFRHGWPTPFGEHEERWKHATGQRWDTEEGPPLVLRIALSNWTAFRMDSVAATVSDVLLSLILIAASGVVVLKLERRGHWRKLQFSIADMFALIATTSMVLGLIGLDARLSIGEDSAAETVYIRLRDLPLFDRVMVLFAIASAVWLIVSTVTDRLGDKSAKKQP
jgi:hypothetical protein